MEPTIYEDALELGARQLDELRAILAPLLDRPFVAGTMLCQFCGQQEGTFDDLGAMVGSHRSDCPVLRRDELLGRT